MEARFRGPGISVRLRIEKPGVTNEKTVPYAVTVDGAPPRTIEIAPEQERYELARGLDPDREHLVRLTRESEAFAGIHQLLGFEPATGGELLPPRAAPKLRIEVLGDSITCGYGVLGKDKSCPFSFATERWSLAYAAVAARRLDADLVTTCWSGRGVYRNYSESGALAIDLFEKTAPPLDATFRHAEHPNVFVVNLGTNDLFSPSGPFDAAAFEKGYRRILARIHEVHPGVPIVATVPAMVEGERRQLAKAGIEHAIAGDKDVELLVFAEQGEKVGCDGHPNAEVQARDGKQLAEAIVRLAAPRD